MRCSELASYDKVFGVGTAVVMVLIQLITRYDRSSELSGRSAFIEELAVDGIVERTEYISPD